MGARAVSNLRLTAGLWLARTGWSPLAGLLLVCAGLALHAWWLPGEQKNLRRLEAEYRGVVAANVMPARPQSDPGTLLAERYAAFNRTLAPRADTTELLKTVFSEAGRAGLTLSQAEYRMGEGRAGAYVTYQMILPVRGPYLKLREFVDGVLAAIPAAALEEISFKRDGIGTATAEARLRLVFYLKDGA